MFDCEETELFWEKMSDQTSYITQEEKSSSEHKSGKDRVMSLSGNVSGALKLEPLLT